MSGSQHKKILDNVQIQNVDLIYGTRRKKTNEKQNNTDPI